MHAQFIKKEIACAIGTRIRMAETVKAYAQGAVVMDPLRRGTAARNAPPTRPPHVILGTF